MPDDEVSDLSGAEERQNWFMNQRFRTIVPSEPARDAEDELPPEVPGDPHDQPAGVPPSLADLMREYRQRLQDAADGV